MMNEADFEGYTGVKLHDFTFSSDMMLVVVLLLLSAFALMFRLNFPLYSKMISNINAGKQRQSIFETTEKDSFLFNVYMAFQTLVLLSIFLFSFAVEYGYITKSSVLSTLLSIGVLLIFLSGFFLFKGLLYAIFSYIFVEQGTHKTILTNYQALFCTWGIVLYIPVLWILLIDRYFLIAITLIIISYLSILITLSSRVFYIFFNKNTGILFLCLYLCAQELVPLVFLYEGLNYTYNIIETYNIWQ